MTGIAAPRVVVVGAGISGLVCAWRVHRAGVPVEVLEASDRAGGVIRTHERDGFVVEAGPNTVQSTDGLAALVAELGLEAELVHADPRMPRWLFFGGRLVRAPLGPVALATTPLLSAGGKLRLLREPWVPRRPGDDDESVASFVERRFGREVEDRLVAPLLGGIFAGDPELLSVRAVFPRLPALEASHGSVVRGFLRGGGAGGGAASRGGGLISFRHGMETLPRVLAERLGERLRLRTRAVGIERSSEGPGLAVSIEDEAGERRLEAPAVVLALEPGSAAAVLARLAPRAADALRSIDLPPVACVSIGARRDNVTASLDGFGFLAPRGQGLRILGAVFGTSLFPGRAPDGFASFTAFVGGATDPDGAVLSDPELARLVRDDLARAVGLRAEARLLAIHRHGRGIPQYTLGHGERQRAVGEALAATPGVFLAGNALHGISVGDCIRQADAVASAVLRELDFSDQPR